MIKCSFCNKAMKFAGIDDLGSGELKLEFRCCKCKLTALKTVDYCKITDFIGLEKSKKLLKNLFTMYQARASELLIAYKTLKGDQDGRD